MDFLRLARDVPLGRVSPTLLTRYDTGVHGSVKRRDSPVRADDSRASEGEAVMRSWLRNASVGTLILAASAALAPAAYAQAEMDQTTTVGEVLVTAQKYEQRLQDVPLSVTAVTSAELDQRNITAISDLQYSVPGLSSFDYGPGGGNFIQLRGIATTIGSSTVGQYIDEMPFNGDVAGSVIDVRALDMERVEVLRGPQGTLYGEGSMGGTIRYITRSPDLSGFSGYAEGQVGTVTDGEESYRAEGVVNIPIVEDKAGLRLLAAYEQQGGWIDATSLGVEDWNTTDILTLRGKLLVEPTDQTRLSLLVLHQESDQDAQNFGDDRKTAAAATPYNNDTYTLVNGVVDHDFGPVGVVASLGYLDRHNEAAFDLTPFYLPVLQAPPPLGLGLPPGFITSIPFPSVNDQKLVTGELRLSSHSQGRFNWTAGGYFRHAESHAVSTVETAPGSLPFAILDFDQQNESTSWAGFGEANYQVTPQLNVLVGLRYYEDHRTTDTRNVNFGFPAVDVGEATFTSLNPRFNVRYEFSPDSMVYFNVAKGFRSGGFNATSAGGGVVTIPPTYDPESLWTYELGTKHQLFDRRLSLEAAVYYNDWKDVQSYFFAPGSAITVIVNGGNVSGWGADLSATARPVDGLTLSATYGWTNLEYTTTTADKFAGDPVDFAVRQSWSASLDYRRPLFGETDGFVRVDYQHASEAQITLRNFAAGQIIAVPARDLVNARVGLDFGKYEVSLFASNLFDETAPLIDGPFGVISENVEQRPRTIGVNLRAEF
jgi:outer membrane receptor protein involved in Fe transport